MRSVVVSCPIDTYSGYGARARDLVKALIETKKYDVKILSQRWGNTRFGYLKDHNETDLASRLVPKLDSKTDIRMQVSVPNEFQAVGNYNIGVTAGMETTLVHQSWLDGCNRMDLVLTSSTHSVNTFKKTVYEERDTNTKQVVRKIELQKPIDIIFEGVDLSKYKPTNSKLDLSDIKESFCYLLVGHWMQGEFGQDRKNVGYTIKSFLEAFKNTDYNITFIKLYNNQYQIIFKKIKNLDDIFKYFHTNLSQTISYKNGILQENKNTPHKFKKILNDVWYNNIFQEFKNMLNKNIII